MISEWLTFLALLALAGIWIGALRSREHALRAARRICETQSVQLLDETVGLGGLQMRRHNGLLQLVLRYDFEVSLDGHDRQRGSLRMAADHVISVSTPWQEARQKPDMTAVAGQKVVQLLHRLHKPD